VSYSITKFVLLLDHYLAQSQSLFAYCIFIVFRITDPNYRHPVCLYSPWVWTVLRTVASHSVFILGVVWSKIVLLCHTWLWYEHVPFHIFTEALKITVFAAIMTRTYSPLSQDQVNW